MGNASIPDSNQVSIPDSNRPLIGIWVDGNIHKTTFDRATHALTQGKSVLIVGEPGSGKTVLGERLAAQLPHYEMAIASYSGALKQTLISIAEQLGCPTENENGKALSADLLRHEIMINCSNNTLIIADGAERWSAGLRYWLEGLHKRGTVLLLLASRNPEKDIFLKMPVTLHLEAVVESQLRSLIEREAQSHQLRLTTTQIANISARSGGNITRAKYLVQQLRLGEESEVFRSSSQYKSIMPFIMAVLAAFSILRYFANGDPAMRLIGGACLVIFLIIRQLGRAM